MQQTSAKYLKNPDPPYSHRSSSEARAPIPAPHPEFSQTPSTSKPIAVIINLNSSVLDSSMQLSVECCRTMCVLNFSCLRELARPSSPTDPAPRRPHPPAPRSRSIGPADWRESAPQACAPGSCGPPVEFSRSSEDPSIWPAQKHRETPLNSLEH